MKKYFKNLIQNSIKSLLKKIVRKQWPDYYIYKCPIGYINWISFSKSVWTSIDLNIVYVKYFLFRTKYTFVLKRIELKPNAFISSLK